MSHLKIIIFRSSNNSQTIDGYFTDSNTFLRKIIIENMKWKYPCMESGRK
uniref:Uncharacterized protein n=1 Tax=Rhizophagus irregularis (strain DAOM 181602 / DAOM 197198 / MUCL 43194) TaxID=747089 RepID=U9UT72_RHIID